ncbi:unnamed protein product [Enterobius vermicularis]|uniref:CaM_binding domain-containing protein n=1 Tax=Enterobius vermicularis TaxID=51028 RepID=A0A0N4UZ78_ENTVE|nr:unnamed protein product [Enterobius vermicularis]
MTHSAVVRARGTCPDVKGVDRFKYFHSPIFGGVNKNGLNIDKKMATLELPQLNVDFSKHSTRSSSNPNVPSASDDDLENVVFGNRLQPLTVSTSLPQLGNPEKKLKVSKCREKILANSVQQLSSEAVIGKSLIPLPSNVKLPVAKTAAKFLPNVSRTAASRRPPKLCQAKVIDGSLTKLNKSKAKIFLTDCSSNTKLLNETSLDFKSIGTQTGTQSFLDVGTTARLCMDSKATQTSLISGVCSVKSICDIDLELERRNELITVVEKALDETIDKRSRLRVSQSIVSSARKQVTILLLETNISLFEVWKDAKEFVTTILLPRSIQEANSTKRRSKSNLSAPS